MTKILGIDYGKRKIGLAMAEGKLAAPLKVIKIKTEEEAMEKIKQTIKEEQIEKVVIGIAEGEMGKQTRKFTTKLKKELNTPIEFWDETLTTKDAQRLSIEAGIQRKKRKELEDAYAATLLLQNYLDSGKVDQG